MATGGNLVETTSDETVFDHICSPCSGEETKKAVGFCVDCKEWLCEECFRVHTVPKPIRHHVLKSAEEMKDAAQGPTGPTVDDMPTEKCARHDGKHIKYFCMEHDFTGCSKCVIDSHRTCNVQNIPDIAKDTATKTEVQQVKTELEEIAKQSNELVNDVRDKITLVKQNKHETVLAFRKYKKELVVSLDNLEVALEDTCSKQEKDEIERLEKIADRCEELEKAGLQTKSQIEVHEDSGQHCYIFVAMKRGGNKVKAMRDSLNEDQDSSAVKLYTFTPNLMTGEILKHPEGLGTLDEKGSKNTDYTKVHAKHLADISIRSEGNDVCIIRGSVLLPGNKLVLTDHATDAVKVVDTTKIQMLSNMKIDGHPWGVCKISDNSVVVTVCNKQRLLFLMVDDAGKLVRIKTVAVSGECRGVAATNDKLIVTYVFPNRMEIMDMNGFVLHTFEGDHQGENLLLCPQYVSLSPDKKTLYVSNWDNHTVVCMSLDGTVTAIYKDDELRGPGQTAVDSNGMVYVAGYLSNNIHLITPDCKKIKLVLNESDGLYYAYAVSCCEESNRLYIAMDDSDVISVIQLK